jgi:type VI secretion system Hcp family effector
MKKVSFLLAFALISNVCFAQGIFLKIPGAPSDGPNGSVIQAYSHGVTNPVSIGTGTGPVVGKPSVSSFNVMKLQSKISLFLLKASLQGQKLGAAELNFYDKDKNLYLRILLEDVFVESFQHSGSRCSESNLSACITESVSLVASKITWDDRKNGTTVSYDVSTTAVQ